MALSHIVVEGLRKFTVVAFPHSYGDEVLFALDGDSHLLRGGAAGHAVATPTHANLWTHLLVSLRNDHIVLRDDGTLMARARKYGVYGTLVQEVVEGRYQGFTVVKVVVVHASRQQQRTRSSTIIMQHF